MLLASHARADSRTPGIRRKERPALGFEQEVVVKRREFVMAATGALAAAPVAQAAVMLSGPPGPSPSKSGYVDVNGLHMYYERHGQGGIPLVLLHGGFSAIGTSFGVLLPGLSAKREVIAFELQGHGHTFRQLHDRRGACWRRRWEILSKKQVEDAEL